MRLTGFARPPARPATQLGVGYTLRPRAQAVAVDGPARASVSLPKNAPVRSNAYLRLVAALPCAVCKRAGPSQAAHANEGKGMAIKSDDRTAFPACADGPGRVGCHAQIDQGAYSRDARRIIERQAAHETRTYFVRTGLWPAGLPMWPDEGQ